MKCPFCGALIQSADVRCPSCGNTIPQLSVASGGQERLSSELSAHSTELEELLRYTPSAARKVVEFALLIVFGLPFTGFAILFIVLARRHGAPLIFRLFPLIFVLVGLVMIAGGLRGLVRLLTSPLIRLSAVILGKREERSTGGETTSTTYYLTMKTDDGREKEYCVPGGLFSRCERGDAGVVYMKGGCLLDFKSVRPGVS